MIGLATVASIDVVSGLQCHLEGGLDRPPSTQAEFLEELAGMPTTHDTRFVSSGKRF